MNKVISPLEVNNRGREVTDLQDALVVLLKRRVIEPANDDERRGLSEGLERERGTETYSDFTARVVALFRRQRRLGESENVDEPTANAINALLEGFGLLEQQPADRSAIVSGQVRAEDGTTVKGGIVRAFHETDQFSIRLGEDATDPEGYRSNVFERSRKLCRWTIVWSSPAKITA